MAGPGAKPTLVIPMAFDGAEALKMLEKLRQGGKEAGDALEDAGAKSKTLGENVRDVISHQGYQMLKDAASTLAEGYKETADYIKTVSTEFINLREILQQVAALKGENNTGDFTVNQARAAQSASLRPEEWVKFQEEFQSYAGAYLEGDQRKMTDAQAEDYQKRLAQFAKARGISPDQAAQLGGGVLQFAEGPINSDEAMNRFGRAFKTLERAPTPVNQLLPAMTKVMAQGADSDAAAQLLALASEFSPGEEETSVTNTLKAINKAILEGKGDELGVSDGMSPLQKVQAASFKLNQRVGAGENLNAMIADYFPDIRETRGAKGFLNRGVVAGGFERVAGYVNETPADFTSTAIADYEASDQGRYARERARLAAARIERGDQFKEVEQARLEAERQLTQEGRFETYGLGDVVREMAEKIPGQVSRKDQLINERAILNTSRRATEAGVDRPWHDQLVYGLSNDDANNAILMLIREQNQMMERDGRKPLSAPPAAPVTRPQ